MLIMAARQKRMKKHKLFNKIDISFLVPFVEDINLDKVVQEIDRKIPPRLFCEIDVVYVGKFDFLDEDGLCSKFMDNAIYLSNSTFYESDVVYDITMALSESIEKKYTHLFYNDDGVIEELEKHTEDLVSVICEYLIEDRKKVKEDLPSIGKILEELMRYGSR